MLLAGSFVFNFYGQNAAIRFQFAYVFFPLVFISVLQYWPSQFHWYLYFCCCLDFSFIATLFSPFGCRLQVLGLNIQALWLEFLALGLQLLAFGLHIQAKWLHFLAFGLHLSASGLHFLALWLQFLAFGSFF